MTIVTLITATPWNATTAAAVTVRMAGGGSKPYTGLNGFADWMAGIVEPARFSAALEFDQNGPTGGAVAQYAAMSFYATTEANRDRLAGYEWIGCSVTIQTCDDALATPVFTLILQGTVSAFECTDDKLGITLTDLSVDFARPVLVDTFAGTGTIEGDAATLGRYKRLTFGRAFNVEGRILNLANNIWEFGDPSKPLQSFDVVRDKGRAGTPVTTVAWAGSIASTYAALIAATPGGGGYAAAPSIACVKWWTQPSGPLTADIKGIVGTGYVETAPEVAAAVLALRSTSTVTNTAAMKTIRPDVAGVHCGDESETIANVLDRTLLGTSLGWVVNADGTVRFAPFTWSGSTETIVATSVARRTMYKPVGKRRLGYARNYRVQTAGEISAAVLDGDVDLTGALGDSFVINPELDPGTAPWLLSGTAVYQAITGFPIARWFTFGVGVGQSIANGNAFTSLNGAKTLYLSSWRYASGASGTFSAIVSFYGADNAQISLSTLDLLAGATAAFTKKSSAAITVPTNATQVIVYYYSNLTAGFVNGGGMRLARTQDAADVTSENTAADTANVGGTPSATLLANLTAATNQANGAETHAQSALTALTNIEADGVLSKNEKPVVVAEIQALNSESTAITAQATSYGITTELSAYATARSNLNTYLNNLTPSFTSYTTNTTINRTTFINTFQALYDARNVLFRKIEAVAGTLAQWGNVAGTTGAPSSYAGPGDNFLKNAALASDTSGWSLSPGIARQAVGGLPLGAWFNFSVGSSLNAIANDNTFIQIGGAKALYASAWGYVGGVGAGLLVIDFYDISGAPAGYSYSLDLTVGGGAFFQKYRARIDSSLWPANATQFVVHFTSNLTSGYLNMGGGRVSLTEDGSDVTANAAVIKTGSIAPFVPGGSFTYTSTFGGGSPSFTVNYTAFTVYRADGTTFTTNTGSQACSVGAGSYGVNPYVVDDGGAGPMTIQFALTGSGSPAIANSTVAQRQAAAVATIQRGITGFGTLQVVVPSSGTGGGGGGGSACAYVETLMPHGGKASDVKAGDPLYVLDETDEWFAEYQVRAVRKDMAHCWRLIAANGATKVVSETTPITTRGGIVGTVAECVGVEIPSLDYGLFSWQRIVAIEDMGPLEVVMISASNGTYFGGEQPDRYLATHNGTYKP